MLQVATCMRSLHGRPLRSASNAICSGPAPRSRHSRARIRASSRNRPTSCTNSTDILQAASVQQRGCYSLRFENGPLRTLELIAPRRTVLQATRHSMRLSQSGLAGKGVGGCLGVLQLHFADVDGVEGIGYDPGSRHRCLQPPRPHQVWEEPCARRCVHRR